MSHICRDDLCWLGVPSVVLPVLCQGPYSYLCPISCLSGWTWGDSNELPSFFLGQKSAHLFSEGPDITISGSVDQRNVCHSYFAVRVKEQP